VAGSHQSARMGRMPVIKIARIVVDTVKALPIRCETLRQHPWLVKEPALAGIDKPTTVSL